MAKAQLEIGVQIDMNSHYKGPDWQDADRKNLKAAVFSDITIKVPPTVMALWKDRSLIKTALSEKEIQDLIDNGFLDLKNDPNSTYELKRTADSPASILYIWRDGERTCVHSYLLQARAHGNQQFSDWTVSHDPAETTKQELTVNLLATFSWPTAVP